MNEQIVEAIKQQSESVFPTDTKHFTGFGLTRRELFAAMAMQGILADPSVGDPKSVASLAVGCSDALIKELDKE